MTGVQTCALPISDTKYVSRKTSVAMLEIPASDSAFEVR